MTGAFHTLDGVLGPQGRHTPLRPWSRSPPWGCCSPGAPAPPPSKLWGPQVKKGQPAPHAPATQTKSSHSSLAKKGSQRSRCLGLSGRQQAEGLEAGRAHVGDGNGPTRLERRTATGREAAVARGPGWARSIRRPAPANRSIRQPAPANRSVRGDGEGASAPLKAERVSSDTSSMLPKRRNCTFHALGRAASPSRRLRRLRTSLPLLLPCDLALAQGARQGRGPHLTSQARTQRLGAPRRASTHPVC